MKSKNSDYEVIGRWFVPTLAWAPCTNWTNSAMLKNWEFKKVNSIITLSGFWLELKETREIVNKRINLALQNGDFGIIDKFMKDTQVIFDDLIALNKRLIEEDKRDIIQVLDDFFKIYTELVSPWIAAIFIGDALQSRVMADAKRYGLEESVAIKLLSPIRKTLAVEQKDEMLEIRNELIKLGMLSRLDDLDYVKKHQPLLLKKMEKHVSKYAWMGNLHFWGNSFDMKELVEQIKKYHEDKEIYQIPKDLNKLFKIVSDVSWVRQQSADLAALVSYSLKPYLSKAAKRLKIDHEDIIWMSYGEIIYNLKNKTYPDKKILDERKKGVGILYKNGKELLVSGKKLGLEMEKWMVDDTIHTDLLKGTIANKGFVKGKVRLMLSAFYQDLKKGEVLVTYETTPDFLPVMSKASAFITEIGGITSHAAIVAREMGKPCIINVKNATNILNDGDLVEVDANTGVVRVIERAKPS